MFGFLKKVKSKINVFSLTLPDFGWQIVDQRSTIIVYVNNDESASISVNYFNKEPDLPTIKDVEFLRNFYRDLITPNNGGLIVTELVSIYGVTAVKTIFKVKQPIGMAYVASVTIPFKNFSFVVKIQAIENGVIGLRDAVVTEKLLGTNEISVGDSGLENWFSDPYDESIIWGVLMNKSEQQKYDSEFPDHPLTVVRQSINKVIEEIQFTNEILTSALFEK